jgi:hypothetical protein
MRRIAITLALALLVGFLSYRTALATMPREQVSTFSRTCPGTVVDAHFDAVTGFPVPPGCTRSGVGEMSLYAGTEMYAHWSRSFWFGLAVVPIAFIALWWFGRWRRSRFSRRSDALGPVATTLALALFLLGCGSAVPPQDRVQLVTDNSDAWFYGGGFRSACWLMPSSGQLIADPEFGTAFGEGTPAKWPPGYTGRRVGPEVEVVNRDGKVVATTSATAMQQLWWAHAKPPGEVLCEVVRSTPNPAR